MLRYDLNEAIAEVLECKWGFHYRQFIPRKIIAMFRQEVINHSHALGSAKEFHIEEIQQIIDHAGLDTNLFPIIVPIYSGKIDEKGNVHIYKSHRCKDRSGDIQIEPKHVEHFMKTVVHDDWRQEMSSNEFVFERADLTALGTEMSYRIYGD